MFAELVEASGSPDVNLADDIAMGFDLMGPYPVGGHVSSQAIVCYTAARTAAWNAVNRAKDDDMRQEIFDATMEECRKGWMRGPFTFDQLPESSILTRRFGVRQSTTLADWSRAMKFRPIDDLHDQLV